MSRRSTVRGEAWYGPASFHEDVVKRLVSIDAARGLAAILVMLAHCTRVLEDPRYFGTLPFGGIFQAGGIRMPFFFAMSGFMLSLVHGREVGRSGRVGPFLLGRFARIYPPYWAVLCLVVPALLVRPDLRATATGWPGFVKSFLLWPQLRTRHLPVAWTLECTVLFYLVFAVIIWRPRVGLAVAAVWQAAILGTIVLGASLHAPWSVLFSPFNLCFVPGAIAGWLVRRATIPRPPVWLALAVAYLLVSETSARLGAPLLALPWRHAANSVAAGVALLGLAGWERQRPLRVPRFIAASGDYSYSLFLVHYPVLALLGRGGTAAGIGRWLGGEVIFLLFAAACLFAGALFYRLVERPLVEWTRWRVGLVRGPASTGVTPEAVPPTRGETG